MSWRPLRTVGLPLAAFAVGLLLLRFGVYGEHEATWPHYLGLGLVCVAMMLRRIAPTTGVIIGTVGFALDLYAGLSLVTAFVYGDNLYAAALRGPRRMPVILLSVGTVVTVSLSTLAWIGQDFSTGLLIAAVLFLVMLSPVGTAYVVMEHRARAEAERDRAEQIARLAEVDRRAALTAERTRMARELHDTVANHLSAIAMSSSALLSRPDLPTGAVRQAVAAIRSDSVTGLTEMRHTIELLREPGTVGEDDIVQHKLSEIDFLLGRMRDAGLEVTLEQRDIPAGLPPAVEFAGYRIVQEALTNALKHGSRARLSIRTRPDGLNITVNNRVTDTSTPIPGSGTGLVGMRERVTILGGRFTAGPCGNDWNVTAVLPIDATEVKP